ncbi:MAG TPA: DNA recombination protein RmuC, partial [bacterium]|nr:DNA recombination protein RmuC [bacterium]
AVKGEFRKFGDILDKVKKKLNEAHNTIEETGVRTRAIERKLRQVEELPSGRGEGILDLAPGDEDEGNAGAESGE